MKREYVKPVIESEEFVANEYVAACWWVTCNPKWVDGLPQDLLNFHRGCKGHSVRVGESEPELTRPDGAWGDNWYYANINGYETHHPVDSKDRTSSEHPNASA